MSDSIEQLIQRVMAINTEQDREILENSFDSVTGVDESNITFVDIVNFINASMEATRVINEKVNLLIDLEKARQEQNNG